MLQPIADFLDSRLCKTYWYLKLQHSKCIESHVYELSGRFNLPTDEVKKVVEANIVVVIDVGCDVCGQYFMPKLPTQAVEVERCGTYRCGMCAGRVGVFT